MLKICALFDHTSTNMYIMLDWIHGSSSEAPNCLVLNLEFIGA